MSYGWDLMEHRGEPDLENYPVWVCDLVHTSPAFTPLFTWLMWNNCAHGCLYAPEVLCEPKSHGCAWRVYKGYGYLTTIAVRDENEIKEREVVFRQRVAPIIDDPWGHWAKLRAELKAFYDSVIPLDVDRINRMELVSHFHDMDAFHRRMWEIHHLALIGLYVPGAIIFPELCPELTGLAPTDAKYSKLLSGYDNALFQLNKGLTKLATRAMELKLEDKFKLSDEEVLSAMEQSDAGRQWLKELNDFLQVDGWRMVRMWEVCTPTWIEKPSLVVPDVRRMIGAGGSHAPDLHRERLAKERKEIEKELLDKVPAEQKEWFSKLMACAQAAQFCSEDHDYWCELRCCSLIRRAAIALGRRFAGFGTLDDPEDIFYLFPDEIGYLGMFEERVDLRSRINKRKEEHKVYLANPPISDELPMFLGDPATLPIALSDALMTPILGMPVAKPEEVGATCVGAASAPGVIEGIARVIMSQSEMDQIQPGEILVTPFTEATWTPIFSIIKAVVTDGGGVMTHAAIVGREYGIPAVVGCQDATVKIKTGDRIKVDGDMLRVYVLE